MKPLRILVVEDEVLLLDLMADTLTACGADVTALADSNVALRALKVEEFDGIFLDLLMPGVGGLELTRETRRSPCNRNTTIVVVTGLNQPDTMRTVFEAGATFLLHKPVDRRKVIRLFETIRGPMTEERRRSRRIVLTNIVKCIHGTKVLEGRRAELSEVGIQFRGDVSWSDFSLRKDQQVLLRFELPGQNRIIETQAVVACDEEKGRVRCFFLGMKESDRDLIREAIAAESQASTAALGGW